MKKTTIPLLRSCFAALLLSIAPVISAAEADYDFEYNGYYYKIISGYACSFCGSLDGTETELVVPSSAVFNGRTLTVTEMSGNSLGQQLRKLTIPNTVNAVEDRAFANAADLEEVVIEDGTEPIDLGLSFLYQETNYVHRSGAFVENRLKHLYVGRNISSEPPFVDYYRNYDGSDDYSAPGAKELLDAVFGQNVTSIGGYFFTGAQKLASVTLGDNIVSIGVGAFRSCTALKRLRLPEGLGEIGERAFSHSELQEITIPDGVKIIRKALFYECQRLCHVTIGSGVTFIQDAAFTRCPMLVTINATCEEAPEVQKSDDLWIDDFPFPTRACLGVLNVPKGSLESYKNADIWQNFADIREVETFEPWDGTKPEFQPYDIASDGFYYSVKSIENKSIELVKVDCMPRIEIPWEARYKGFIGNVTSIGREAFSECGDGVIEIPRNISDFHAEAFSGSQVSRLVLRDAEELLERSAWWPVERGFLLAEQLQDIYIGRPIGDLTFYFGNNPKLEKVSFGGGLKKIPYSEYSGSSFTGCKAIKEVNCLLEVPPVLDSRAFEGVVYFNAVLNVPRGAAAAYRAAEGWKEFYTINEVDEFDVDMGSVESVAASPVGTPTVAVSGFEITVSGQDVGSLEVYGSNGMLVYAGKATTVTVPGRGLYIVRVGNRAVKVAVR